MSRDRPTTFGIIKFNARTNSVCSSPSSSSCCTASSSRRVDILSSSSMGAAESSSAIVAEQQMLQQRFVELCANDEEDNECHGNAQNSAPVSEADECGSVADDGENLVQTFGVIISPADVPVEEVIKSVKLVDKAITSNSKNGVMVVTQPKMEEDEKTLSQTSDGCHSHNFWHKFSAIFHHYRTLPFRRLRLFSVAFLLIAFFILPPFFAGLLTGAYLSLLTFLFCCVSDPLTPSQRWRQDQQRLPSIEQLEHVGMEFDDDQIEPMAENDEEKQRPSSSTGRIYKGWMNILSEHYHPHTFHVNSIQTVLVRLDGHILRISRPERTMLKHCFHIDPTLTEPEPRMISQKIYDLTGAQVLLRPRRLARRRWFSRKYPICIKLAPTNAAKSSGAAAAAGMKRWHSLRQKTEMDQNHQQHNTINGKEWEEEGGDDNSEGAESVGDSVKSESTDDEMDFCRRSSSCAQRQQLLIVSTPPHQQQQPLLSTSCPTPSAAPAALSLSSLPPCRCCLSSSTASSVQQCRRRLPPCRSRRSTVPPPHDNDNKNNINEEEGEKEDKNGGICTTTTTTAPKLQQQQHQILRRTHCSSSSAAGGAYIFLFARSTREKERWFHQLRQAVLHQQIVAACFSAANLSAKNVPRCTSVPSLERLGAKLSDERVAYTLQNAQFAKQLAAMIAELGCAAAAGTSSSCGVGDDEQQRDGGVGGGTFVRMDLGWTTNSNSSGSSRNNCNTTNNGGTQKQQQQSVEKEEDEVTEQYNSKEFILLVNLIASRVFYDFCRDSYWCGAVRNKIQTKLATIHLPYFIDTLELSKLDLGTTTPQIVKVHSPTVNEWGIWCDFDIKYEGMIRLVLETRVNLMKLKSVSESTTATTPSTQSSSCPIIAGGVANANNGAVVDSSSAAGDEQQQQHKRHSCGGCCAGGAQTTTTSSMRSLPLSCSTYRIAPSRYSDEEIPESPETSPDEEFGSKLKPDDWLGNNNSNGTAASTTTTNTKRMKTGQKLISWVDRIAHTKYFREASELKLIRKMMEEISSMRLLLDVQVTTLEGRMCCNLAPPPSDRLWYAFRFPPRMSVKAVPQVGDRSVELSLVSEWIENKLQLILEKNLVLPNMDDVIVPVCSGNKLLQGGLNK